jgi:hypothetical protein
MNNTTSPDTVTIRGAWLTKQIFLNGKELSIGRSLKFMNHSPTGFSYGYGGSGPAQLALAICLELLDEEIALRVYQDFKWKFLAKLEPSNFSLELSVPHLKIWAAQLIEVKEFQDIK